MQKKKVEKPQEQEESKEEKIDFKAIEQRWQCQWEKKGIFQVDEEPNKEKYYVLEMFPYPSASFLHMGHVRNYSIGDVIARFKRMQGYNVLYPMGYDSFGLPAENAAKKEGIHPKIYAENAIKMIIKYQKELGLSYDWTRMIATHTPEYYKWNQWIFLEFMKKGLVYRKMAKVNWCDNCNSVLANEEVISGKCWRCENEVIEKELEQWFFRITEYADELLRDIDKLQWSEQIKSLQKNWIGKSFGINVDFKIFGKPWEIFTTRPDTIYGVTFMVISAQHPELMKLVTDKQKPQVEKFLKKIKSTTQDFEELDKLGVFTGSYAVNPVNNEKVPVYVGNFVLAEYGSGMVMAVPAHDQRDFEFAKKYKLPIKIVIQPPYEKSNKLNEKTMKEAYVGEGTIVNSDYFDGIPSSKAIEKISDYLENKKLGKRTTNYKIKDWCISRQRYWGTPIPIIYCDKCGIVPVQEKDLPVLLPEDVSFKGTGNPILTSKKFQETICPKCKGKARRETDTMGGFMDSSWYFLRYCDAHNDKKAFDDKKVHYWMPVDQYVGGIEHAVGHLIYARFFTKALRDLKYLKFDEPFTRLFNQGIVYKDGKRMSKSHGNTVTPDEISKRYGIDTARLFLLFVASPESNMEYTDEGIESMSKFIRKIFALSKKSLSRSNERIEHYTNKAIKEITEDIENFKFNMAIIKLVAFEEQLEKEMSAESFEVLLKLLSPFAPHITEELWHGIRKKDFISVEEWPEFDEKKIHARFDELEKASSQLKQDILQVLKIINKKPKAIYIYCIPKETQIYEQQTEELGKAFSCKINVMPNNKAAYDPQNKAGKAKPGKPALYIE